MSKLLRTLEEVSVPRPHRLGLMQTYPPAGAGVPNCRMRYKGTWTCTRPLGHGGKHAAHQTDLQAPVGAVPLSVAAVWE